VFGGLVWVFSLVPYSEVQFVLLLRCVGPMCTDRRSEGATKVTVEKKL
jgi:hypothetical protein